MHAASREALAAAELRLLDVIVMLVGASGAGKSSLMRAGLSPADLAYYSGDDPLNLPWLALGAAGVVSVIGHVVGDRLRAMVDAVDAGDLAAARAVHTELLPLHRAMSAIGGGVIFAKTALRLTGVDVGDPRLPLPPATAEQTASLADVLRGVGLEVSA